MYLNLVVDGIVLEILKLNATDREDASNAFIT